jgi:hypothetical protein
MDIINYAEQINKINNNDYFVNLPNLSISQFLKTQECFISAVDHWSKMLGLMLYHLPTEKRVVIIRNLYDEHGEGDLSKTHTNTFKLLLESLNYKENILIYNPNLPSYSIVSKFNQGLYDAINSESWQYSVAMMGMIEYTYITVSTHIHHYLTKYLPVENINHYSLHEVLDVEHATELFGLLDENINENIKEDIINGMNKGYELMNTLYDELSKL